jgi:hypothetical protein
MLTAIFISSSLNLRIRFGFSGLVNIHRQLGDIHCNPSGLILAEQLGCGSSPRLVVF